MRDIRYQLQALGDPTRRLLPRQIPELVGWRLAAHYCLGRWPGGALEAAAIRPRSGLRNARSRPAAAAPERPA